MRYNYKILFAALIFLLFTNTFAANRVVNLHVNCKLVNYCGKTVKALAVNNQIPGPTLHFKEGDDVTINVYNHLNVGTAIHWHGILLPWHMDGVAHVSQMPIPPGCMFRYHYTLKQSGTYWYHAHADLQEQEGIYGAYLIDPIRPERYRYNKDFVVFFSDWIDTNADQVYFNLKKDGDYYSPRFPLQPSLTHFLSSYYRGCPKDRKELVDAYAMMQTMRMSPYDFSDVAYDTFLMNGHTTRCPWVAKVKVGDVVRLRFIDGGGSTLFHIKIPNTMMKVVHVQGNDVKPYEVCDLTMAPGETYDVLIKIKDQGPYIIYAESNDKLGKIYGALVTDENQAIAFNSVEPFPEPKPIMMMQHDGMNMGGNMNSNMSSHSEHQMSGMNMSSMHNMPMSSGHSMMKMQNTMQAMGAPKYQQLASVVPTNNPNVPVKTINVELFGYMDRYMWFINGVPEYRAQPILIEPGKWYRFVFINKAMMHHPMHLHGHWMIMRNGHGIYDPKVHTIDVGPNETITADFQADAGSGFWYFHCHNLFHMKAGMANMVHYENTAVPDYLLAYGHEVTAHPALWYRATYLELGADPFDTIYQLTFKTLFGPDYDKLELYTEDAEVNQGIVENADIDIFYWHLISQFWAVKGGVNYFYRPAQKPYWQPGVGIEGLMPYFIDTNLRVYYYAGSVKADLQLSRDNQIGNNFFIRTGIRSILATKTVTQAEIGSGLNEMRFILTPYYRLMPGVNVYMEYERQQNYGVTQSIMNNNGESTIENTITLGLALTF